MNNKIILFVGIILLAAGIILKIFSQIPFLPLILILSGVAAKIYYIIAKIISGEYKPGAEFILFLVGLALFMTGIYLKNHPADFSYMFLTFPGIFLKVLFIVIFIRKSQKKI